MKVQKSLGVDEIYEQVKGRGLVLSTEAPLVDALNRRVKEPGLGRFAVTPKRLVYNETGKRLMDKRDLFHLLVRETEMGLKQASYLLENAISCWMETGEVESITGYRRFKSDAMKKVVELLKNTDNIFRAMESFEIEEKDVVVVGIHQFNGLDLKVLPDSYDVLDIFAEDKIELPEFSVFNSEVEIVRAVRDNIDPDNPNRFALVMEPGSSYQPLIETMLDAEGVPYMVQRELRESLGLRDFLSLCRTADSVKSSKVRDLQPVLRFLGIEVPIEYNEQYAKDLDIEELDEFKDFLDKIQGRTLSEVLEEFGDVYERDLGGIEEVFESLGIEDKTPNEEILNALELYLDIFEVPFEEIKKKSVLFVSPKNVAWVDRPVVFHIGMDSDWVCDVPKRPWIDKDKKEETNLTNFKILLQNTNSYYMVQDTYLSESVTPCFYFNELTTDNFDSFVDLNHSRYNHPSEDKKKKFKKKQIDIQPDKETTISQSSLNRLTQCPRNYFFSKLISSIDRDFFRKGNLFHDFAEFYVNHPDFVEEGRNKLVDLMVDEMKPLVDDLDLPILRTEFMVGTDNIIKYLKEEGFSGSKPQDCYREKTDNFFSKATGRTIDVEITEMWFEDPDLGARGIIDLVKDEGHLVDYKSGRRKSPGDVVKRSNLDLLEDDPNFQAILYLSYLRKQRPRQKLKFTFFHFLDNIDDKISGTADYKDNICTLTYFPCTFEEQIKRRETFQSLLGRSKKRTGFLKDLGYSSFKEALDEFEVPRQLQYDKRRLVEEKVDDLRRRFSAYFDIGHRKDYTENQIQGICAGILKNLVDFRRKNYFKEDLDAFDEFLEKKIEELNDYKKSRFPVGDVDLDKIDNKDLILKGVY